MTLGFRRLADALADPDMPAPTCGGVILMFAYEPRHTAAFMRFFPEAVPKTGKLDGKWFDVVVKFGSLDIQLSAMASSCAEMAPTGETVQVQNYKLKPEPVTADNF